MDFRFTAEEEAFRQEVRRFIKENLTVEMTKGEGGGLWSTPEKRRFAKLMSKKGWIGISWPKEYGGQGRPSIYQYILTDELSAALAPHTGGGVGTIGTTLMHHAGEEMKRDILPRIIAADIEFAIGYSEPNAGSDLAGVETRAELKGDDYIINGQKLWTSAAHFADYFWLVVRTDQKAPKHKGISLFLFPMNVPGIRIEPIYKIGDMRNNVVYLDNVRVPRSALVGQENKGWYYVAEALDHERSHLFPFGPIKRSMDRLRALAHSAPDSIKGTPYWKVLRHRVAEREIETQVQHVFSLRVLDIERRKGVANVEASISKVFGTELQIRLAQTNYQLASHFGELRHGSKHHVVGDVVGDMARAYEASLIPPVAGGANEINRTVIATRGLGLPRG
ncbi:MAG: acyl-CoA dehydrogenase [Chloroflexi bacterium]|nr:acyl-CoA dehydrogenase [Chloroflexota bacterium]